MLGAEALKDRFFAVGEGESSIHAPYLSGKSSRPGPNQYSPQPPCVRGL